MAQVPSFLLNMIRDVPESAFERVMVSLKITERKEFKEYASKRIASKTLYGDFVLTLFSYDRAAVATLYKSIEGVLFVGGCVPGVGIAFNLVDACFCFILGNWLGCFVAILSCFPIPGFKLAGKGAEKFIMVLLKRISPLHLQSLIKKLGLRLSKTGYHTTESYIAIRKRIESLLPGLHNPFVECIIRELSKIIQRFPVSSNGISKSVSQSGGDLIQRHSIQPKLLEMTRKSSHL